MAGFVCSNSSFDVDRPIHRDAQELRMSLRGHWIAVQYSATHAVTMMSNSSGNLGPVQPEFPRFEVTPVGRARGTASTHDKGNLPALLQR